MRIIRIAALIIWPILALAAKGNPLVWEQGGTLVKTHEKCAIGIGKEDSKVSCSIRYKVIERRSERISILVPILCDSSKEEPDAAWVEKSAAPRLECEGVIYKAGYINTSMASLPPWNGEPWEVQGEFSIPFPKGTEFTIVVSYRQPHIAGVAHYLPLFEDGDAARRREDFEIEFFPLEDFQLRLLTSHPERAEVSRSRISIVPKHRELISIQSSPIESLETASEAPDKPIEPTVSPDD